MVSSSILCCGAEEYLFVEHLLSGNGRSTIFPPMGNRGKLDYYTGVSFFCYFFHCGVMLGQRMALKDRINIHSGPEVPCGLSSQVAFFH